MMVQEYRESASGALFTMVDGFEPDFVEREKPNSLYKIIWCKSRELSLNIDGIPVNLQADQMLFLTPGHHILDFQPSGESFCFLFNREFYCILNHDHEVSCIGFLFYGSTGPVIIALDIEEQMKYGLLLGVFHDEIQTCDNIQGEMLRMLLKRLIIKSTRIAKSQLRAPIPVGFVFESVRKFNLLVELHFKEKKTVAEYADLMHKSAKTLSNLFRIASQPTPLNIIHERIVLEAMRLLMFTNKSVKEISAELGFADTSNFGRLFKNATGKTPFEFKNGPQQTLNGKN